MNNNIQKSIARSKVRESLATALMLPMAIIGSNLQAATVHLAGQTVDFYYDDIQPGLAYFGAPQLSASGNELIIASQPTGMYAQSVDGVGDHTGSFTDAISMSFTIRAVARSADASFASIDYLQSGVYSMSSSDPGNTFVAVGSILSVVNTTDIANEYPTEIRSYSDLTIADGNLHSWRASGTTDLSGANFSGVGDIMVSLVANLTAGSAGVGDSAFIEISGYGGGIVIGLNSVVPVPAALWLFGSGLLGMVGVASVRGRIGRAGPQVP